MTEDMAACVSSWTGKVRVEESVYVLEHERQPSSLNMRQSMLARVHTTALYMWHAAGVADTHVT